MTPSTASSLKRSPPSPLSSLPKRQRISTDDILRNHNGQVPTSRIDAEPSRITSTNIYLAAAGTSRGSENSLDMSNIEVSEGAEGGCKQAISTFLGKKEDRSATRKILLCDTHAQKRLDEGKKRLLYLNYLINVGERKEAFESLHELEKELRCTQVRYRCVVFATLLQSLNDIIFNPNPTPTERRHPGVVLNENQLGQLKQRRKITILKWKPTSDRSIMLKEQASSCLTKKQLELAQVLLNSDVPQLSYKNRHHEHHLRLSQAGAKSVIDDFFQDKLSNFSNVSREDFYSAIEHAPLPIQKSGSEPVKPFFKFVEDVIRYGSPDRLKAQIKNLNAEIASWNSIIVKCEDEAGSPF
ncbi:hypothetical protein BDP27DRAFT_1412097 [Rhodocollybia butyracea]|uniref:Uncharacterized protein n=1 Tax=Rhodocollybia butyracea TaxID=206335 RepID=A0A9P5P443_9AGAR|nr:hypothetical protein BDP27DRAFT_1412097 [Rhodocollybia butyracea]